MPLTYNINKQRTPYWRFIENICRALIKLANTQNAGLKEDADLTITWDDSLLKDPEVEKTADMQAVSQGIMTAWEFRVKWMGDTKEEAKKILEEEKKNNPMIDDMFNSGNFRNE